MKTLKVLLTTAETIVPLHTPWKITNEFISVKSGFIFWNWNNIPEDLEVLSGTTKILFTKGYWSVDEIAAKFKSVGIDCKIDLKDLSVEITPKTGKSLKLQKLGKYLGFEDNTTLTKKTKSGEVDVNLGLKFINISCDIVNREQTFFNGTPSRVLFSVPITSIQTLKGSVCNFAETRSLINLDSGVYNELRFAVSSNLGREIDVGSIMLDLEIL